MDGNRKSRDGRMAAATLSAAFLFALLYRGSPEGYGDLIAFLTLVTLTTFTMGFGISSVRHSSGGDKKVGIGALILAVVSVVWVLAWVPFHWDR